MAYRYLQYAAGYYGIEADTRAGEIAQESLEEQAGVLEKGEASFLEEAAQLERLLAGVGDIVSISAPPTAEVETGFREMHREVQGLWEEVGEYEEARLASDFADMEEAMEKLESLIGRVSGKGSVRIGGYRAGELLEYEETARLEELAEERRGYLLEAVPGMEEQMLSCQDRIMARQREELGRQQVIEGTVAGAFVLVSAAVVIGSGFSAAPAAAFLGEAVLGTLTFTAVAYQDAKVMEGFHNIALGRAGDITSAAGNPIRDLLPEQLHGAYQAIGEGSTWAVEAWGMGCTLWRAWGQAGVRGAAEELGKIGLAGYGAGKAGEVAEAYGMSGSQVMIIETLSSVGIYRTLSRIRPAAETLGRRRNGLERRGTSAESTEVMRLPGEGAAEYRSFWCRWRNWHYGKEIRIFCGTEAEWSRQGKN